MCVYQCISFYSFFIVHILLVWKIRGLKGPYVHSSPKHNKTVGCARSVFLTANKQGLFFSFSNFIRELSIFSIYTTTEKFYWHGTAWTEKKCFSRKYAETTKKAEYCFFKIILAITFFVVYKGIDSVSWKKLYVSPVDMPVLRNLYD